MPSSRRIAKRRKLLVRPSRGWRCWRPKRKSASGWLSRAKRHLDETDEAPEHGYWALQRSLVALGEHDYDEAFRQGKAAEEIGKRFGDRSLEIRGIQRQGAALLEKGEVGEGKMLLDEASAAN